MRTRVANSGVRLPELMAALSMATDLGMGQPVESALSSCVVAMRLGDSLGLDEETMRDVYYQALLRYIGCNADTHALAAIFGDELVLRHDFAALDPGEPVQVVELAISFIRQANAAEAPERLAALVSRILMTLPEMMHESFAGHCELAQMLAERLGLPESLIVCLGQLYERWDGKGQPNGLQGHEVAVPVVVVTLAQDAVIWARIGGVEAAVATIHKRSGAAYHPEMAERFCQEAAKLLDGLDQEPTWESVLALEPGSPEPLSDEDFDRCCAAMADFADIKSPFTLGHSSGVAELASGAGRRAGLIDADVTTLRRAGLLHDIGRVGVSAGIWGRPGPLSQRDWEQVRLHPYYTERVLARPESLGKVGLLASQHHERTDRSGYHRGSGASALSMSARILAAADAYHAMTEERPYRAALTPERAAEALRGEVRAGRLDGDAVHAVLAEAGHRVPRTRRVRPAGLSEREVEVLRLIARGLSNRDMAEQLYVSPDTVKHHIQHIYDKIGLSTRAGATLYAVENNLY